MSRAARRAAVVFQLTQGPWKTQGPRGALAQMEMNAGNNVGGHRVFALGMFSWRMCAKVFLHYVCVVGIFT
jgi:hypothetical protein